MAKLQKLSAVDLAYMVGFFDGEGCVSIIKCHYKVKGKSYYRYYLMTGICQLEREPLEIFLKYFKGNIREKVQVNGKIGHEWKTASRLAATFLETILPYLKGKKEEAEIALKFQKTMSYGPAKKEILEIREEFHVRCRQIKDSKGRRK